MLLGFGSVDVDTWSACDPAVRVSRLLGSLCAWACQVVVLTGGAVCCIYLIWLLLHLSAECYASAGHPRRRSLLSKSQ